MVSNQTEKNLSYREVTIKKTHGGIRHFPWDNYKAEPVTVSTWKGKKNLNALRMKCCAEDLTKVKRDNVITTLRNRLGLCLTPPELNSLLEKKKNPTLGSFFSISYNPIYVEGKDFLLIDIYNLFDLKEISKAFLETCENELCIIKVNAASLAKFPMTNQTGEQGFAEERKHTWNEDNGINKRKRTNEFNKTEEIIELDNLNLVVPPTRPPKMVLNKSGCVSKWSLWNKGKIPNQRSVAKNNISVSEPQCLMTNPNSDGPKLHGILEKDPSINSRIGMKLDLGGYAIGKWPANLDPVSELPNVSTLPFACWSDNNVTRLENFFLLYQKDSLTSEQRDKISEIKKNTIDKVIEKKENQTFPTLYEKIKFEGVENNIIPNESIENYHQGYWCLRTGRYLKAIVMFYGCYPTLRKIATLKNIPDLYKTFPNNCLSFLFESLTAYANNHCGPAKNKTEFFSTRYFIEKENFIRIVDEVLELRQFTQYMTALLKTTPSPMVNLIQINEKDKEVKTNVTSMRKF